LRDARSRVLPALAACAVLAAAGHAQEQQPFSERVDVQRVLLDVHVTDGYGQPLEDLTAGDFRVRIGGTVARVESAIWVAGALRDETASALLRSPAATAPVAVDGRLIVFLIQKDLEPSRIIGLMRLLIEAKPFFASFTPRDRIAVLSFDSRLRVWTDFTNDLERIRALLQHDILMSAPPPLSASEPPSLIARLQSRQADEAGSMERALELVGHLLEPLPGAKNVVVFGHGFGRLGSSGVVLAQDYDLAQKALRAARASVFCLDVTQADYHSLEAGLQQVAGDTGGFYERTFLFPTRALNRLAGTLAGHYVLFIERPPTKKKGPQRIEVEVPHRDATVLAKDSID
jgi:VWFA-related protein